MALTKVTNDLQDALAAAQPTITSVGTLTGLTVTGEITANAGIALPDSQKATFGAGDDLQIYHDGSNSYISDVGVGNLNLQGNHLILEDPNGVNFLGGNGSTGAVTLYNSGNAKLATTSTGIDVTGTATMDGLTVDGNVGIGISAVNTTYGASHALQIASISDNNWSGTLILSSADGTSVFSRLAASTNGFDLINTKSTDMRFFTNNTLRMSITNVGNLLIGDNAQANGNNSTCTIQSGGTVAISRAATNAQNQMIFYNPNGAVGSIKTNGSATAFNTSSDYRLKENVVPMTGSIDRVKALNPSRFNFIADADTTVDGFLAHEVEAVVPEAISGTKDAMRDEEYEVEAAVEEVRDEDDNVTTEAAEAVMGTRSVPDMQGIDQSKLVPLLVAALQEAIARIEILEGA